MRKIINKCVDCRYGWWINACFLSLGFLCVIRHFSTALFRFGSFFANHWIDQVEEKKSEKNIALSSDGDDTQKKKKIGRCVRRGGFHWHRFICGAIFSPIFRIAVSKRKTIFIRLSWIIHFVGWSKSLHYIDLRFSFRKTSANIVHQIWRVKNEQMLIFLWRLMYNEIVSIFHRHNIMMLGTRHRHNQPLFILHNLYDVLISWLKLSVSKNTKLTGNIVI